MKFEETVSDRHEEKWQKINGMKKRNGILI